MKTEDGVPDVAEAAEGERYRIGELIGRGGLGEVYRAEDTQLCRMVAVKRLYGEEATSDSSTKILQEARHLAALQHPNIVTVYDVIANHGDVVVIMELLQGRTLQEIAEIAPLALEDFVEVMRQALEGLAAAHAHGIIHRDIKPSNLMLSQLPTGASQLKILDFGMAKASPEPSMQTKDNNGALMGSIYMMSPEQLEGSPVDARSDLYSLGCVAYFALTASYPYAGRTVVEVIAAHFQARRHPLGQMRPDLPPAVCHWVDRLMAIRPDDRPSSAAEAFAELYAALHHQPEPAPAPPPPPARSRIRLPKFEFRLPAISGADVAVGVLLVAIGWFCYYQLAKSNNPFSTAPRFDSQQRSSFIGRTGETATVEGVVADVIREKQGGMWRVTFQGSAENDLSLLFFSMDNPSALMARLSSYKGKRIRVSGTVSVQDGAPSIFVESFSQVETL